MIEAGSHKAARVPPRGWVSAMTMLMVASLSMINLSSRGDDSEISTFQTKILPVLSKKCYECHSKKANKAEGGLTLDTIAAMRRGGDRGPAVVPNDVAESILIDALKYSDDDLQMPPDGKLPDQVIADFQRWIENGASDE